MNWLKSTAVSFNGDGQLTGLANGALELRDLGLGGVLAQRAEELAERLARNLARAALVEEGERLLVLCVSDSTRRGRW